MTAANAALSSRAIDSLSLYYRLARRVRRRASASRNVFENRSHFYTALWWEAAARVGAEVVDMGLSRMEIRRGEMRLLVSDNLTSLDDPVTLAVAGDKPLVYRMLAGRGLPVPRHFVCRRDDWAGARRAVALLAGPVLRSPPMEAGPATVSPVVCTGGSDWLGHLPLPASSRRRWCSKSRWRATTIAFSTWTASCWTSFGASLHCFAATGTPRSDSW